MFRSTYVKSLLVVLIGLLAGSQSFADLSYGSWFLDQSNSLADDTNYGRVDIAANSATGLVQFHVVRRAGRQPGVSEFRVQLHRNLGSALELVIRAAQQLGHEHRRQPGRLRQLPGGGK